MSSFDRAMMQHARTGSPAVTTCCPRPPSSHSNFSDPGFLSCCGHCHLPPAQEPTTTAATIILTVGSDSQQNYCCHSYFLLTFHASWIAPTELSYICDDNDDDEFLSTSKELLDDNMVGKKGSKKGVGNRKAPSIAIDSEDIRSDEEDEKSRSEFQKFLDEEAKAAGRSTRNSGKRKTTAATSTEEDSPRGKRKRPTVGNKGAQKSKRG